MRLLIRSNGTTEETKVLVVNDGGEIGAELDNVVSVSWRADVQGRTRVCTAELVVAQPYVEVQGELLTSVQKRNPLVLFHDQVRRMRDLQREFFRLDRNDPKKRQVMSEAKRAEAVVDRSLQVQAAGSEADR